MSATQDIAMKIAKNEYVSFPVAASTTIYKGSMVSKQEGYAEALTDGAKFDGHAMAQVKNTTANGYGTAGDLDIQVLSGKYKLQVSITSNEKMVGMLVYAVDDSTYTVAPMRTIVGKIVQYVSSSEAIVEFDTNISRENVGGVKGTFESFKKIPSMGANTAGVEFIRTSVNGPGTVVGIEDGEAYCGGVAFTTDTAENDGESIQLNGELIKLDSASKPFAFGCRVMVDDATQSDIFLGVAITDTALLGAVSDDISFRKVDGETDVKLYVEKNSTETVSASLHTLADATAVTLSCVYNGSNVTPYVNGVAGTALAVDNLPDDEGLTLSIEILTGEGAARTLTVSFADAYQIA